MNELDQSFIQNQQEQVVEILMHASRKQFDEINHFHCLTLQKKGITIQSEYLKQYGQKYKIIHQFYNIINIVLHFICFYDHMESFDFVMNYIEQMIQQKMINHSQVRETLLARNDDDYTPFHLAVYKGNLKMIERMMKYNIDIQTRARKVSSFIVHSNINRTHRFAFSCIRKSSSCYCIKNQMLNIYDYHYFFEMGISIDMKNQNGGSALHYASFSKSAECVMYLLSKGSDVNLQDSQGVTPIYLAAMQPENTYIANKLLKRGANAHIKNKEGIDAIQAAKNRSNNDMVKLLSKKDGIIELMNIKQAQKPVRCKLLPLALYFVLYFSITLSTSLFTVPCKYFIMWKMLHGSSHFISLLQLVSFHFYSAGLLILDILTHLNYQVIYNINQHVYNRIMMKMKYAMTASYQGLLVPNTANTVIVVFKCMIITVHGSIIVLEQGTFFIFKYLFFQLSFILYSPQL